MARTRIVLADDHRMFAEGIKRSLEPEFEVPFVADNGKQLVAAVLEHRPAVVVTDISMPDLNGIEAARQIREHRPEVHVILLTMHEDPVYAATALDEGVNGYVLKTAPISELCRAIRDAMSGHVYIAASIASAVFQLRRRNAAQALQGTVRITPRQREILRLLAEGRTIKEIAATLSVSSKAVEYHKYRLMDQLKVKTNAELILYAARIGIVTS